MSVTTKTTMTGERRNTPKPPGRKTRPEGTAAAPGRAGSSHPGSARRASTTSTNTRRTAQKEKVGASSRAATAGSTTRTSTPSRARTTETARPQGAGATRTSRGATLLDAPARFLAYTRGVAGVFEKPSTAQFEANTTSVRPKPSRGGTAGRAEVREASGAKKRAPLARSLRKPTRRGGIMSLLMWAVFLVIPLFLIFNLLMNILVAQRQYELVDMHAQELALTQQNEALHQELGYNEAPQDLAIRASLLNMFPSTTPATLDVQNGTIQGTPTPAASPTSANGTRGNLVPAPATRDNDPSGQKAADAQKQAQEKTAKQNREREEKEKQEKEKASAPASPSPSASPQSSQSPQQAQPSQAAPSASANR
ncbi:hypothetical protein B9K03_04190 [Rothia sp. Olga]|nr:hypothetical protein B9K03_04190 [Rothia sp. Olga]TEA43772.1 hypothetical protein C0Z14_04040 [Rothia aeria]